MESQNENGNPALYLHREFELRAPKSATLLYAGLGLCVIYINGRRVGDAVLQSAFTDYRKSVLCEREDVTGLLLSGKNVIDVILGDGWYNQTAKDTWGFWRAEWRGARKLRLALIVGEETVLCSDTDWLMSAEGEIRSSSIRLGERHNCCKSIDWLRALPAVETEAPKGTLKICEMPPIRECEALDFVSCAPYSGGYLLDFGKSMAGYVRIEGNFPAGTIIKVRHGDRLENGRIDNTSNAQYIDNQVFEYQTDVYIADGTARVYFPLFVYHGYRYAEIEGLPEEPNKGSIKGISIHTDFARIGGFTCSDERLNTLYEMSIAASEANYVGIPTDCPHREKNGWTGDAQLSVEHYLLNYACEQNLLKWLEDIAEAQHKDGAVPCIVPTSGWGFDWGNGPAWDFALFALPRALKKYRGIENSVLQTAIRYHAFLETKSREHLVDWGLGDWNFPKCVPKDRIAPRELTSSCYYLEMTRLLAQWTGEMRYASLAEQIEGAIRQKYAGDTRMGSLACLTYFGIADRTEALLEALEANGWRYAAGILGVQYINNVLISHGHCDAFLRLLRTRGYPSFLEWADRGGTALWEDFEGTNSRCHQMYADLAAVLIKGVGGIRVRSAECVELCPDPVDLSSFEAHTALPSGTVSVAYASGAFTVRITGALEAVWTKDGGQILLKEGTHTLA